ncbi:hypothetical protein F5877DRAFT_82835 [Lentinula edodes]|nr:hypothetical protein F5877DRAFT_82835 [Lentinula edodes]
MPIYVSQAAGHETCDLCQCGHLSSTCSSFGDVTRSVTHLKARFSIGHSSEGALLVWATHLKIAFLILFSAASAARPGSIVKSSCYCSSNEALTWGDLDFYLIPDDEDPAHPSLVIDIQLNLVKGYCNMDHRYQKVLFTLEIRKEHRMTCIVLPLLGLAFQDSVFAHFHSVDSLLCPERPHTTEEQGGISDTEAMTHGSWLSHLNKLSIAAGFPKPLTPYNLRASQGNKADVELGETARKTLMLHDPKSQVYFARKFNPFQDQILTELLEQIQVKTITADLSAVSNRRNQDQNKVKLFWQTIAVSSGQDTNAPTDLTLKERENLLNEPELVKLQNKKDKATNKIRQLLANEQSEEVKVQIAELQRISILTWLYMFAYSCIDRNLPSTTKPGEHVHHCTRKVLSEKATAQVQASLPPRNANMDIALNFSISGQSS